MITNYFGQLIAQKNGFQVFKSVKNNVTTLTSYKDGKIFKSIEKSWQNSKTRKTVVKNFSTNKQCTITHDLRKGLIGPYGRIKTTILKYITNLSPANQDTFSIESTKIRVFKNRITKISKTITDNKFHTTLDTTVRKGSKILKHSSRDVRRT